MKKIEKITIELEEHEIGALKVISGTDCTKYTIQCAECPFNLRVGVPCNTGKIKCLAVLCGAIAEGMR